MTNGAEHPPCPFLCRIGFNLIAALLPTKGRFVPDEEELTPRPKGPLQDPKISLATPLKVRLMLPHLTVNASMVGFERCEVC